MPTPCELAAISQPTREAEPPTPLWGDSHRGEGTVPEEPGRSRGASLGLGKHLVLRENRLQALKPAWFRHLPRLLWLDLSDNALTEVPPEVFHPLGSLRSLDLSHNRLVSLAPGALAGLRALERLDLEGNRLGTLSSATFAPVPALRLLFLQDNELQALPAGIFVPLRHLSVLDLARNQLRALELPPRPPGPVLDLDISGNPWDCGCQLVALLRRVTPRLTATRDTVCASPPRHRGQEVASVVQAGDTGCEPGEDMQHLPDTEAGGLVSP
ncbi:leucine-rich alpha-2-glycoprotein isoform X2 [Columba livia]|uniref:leucine-rich alpha-2-glycoprotein isoform X2 n=1 Tax=Columba livia TaxID=8932 RepID=UPI0031BAB022